MQRLKKMHILTLLVVMLVFSSCRLWEKVFPPKYGCGTNGGRNVGAEQLLKENQKGKKKKKEAKFRG